MNLFKTNIRLRPPKTGINLIQKNRYFRNGLSVLVMGLLILGISGAFILLGALPRYSVNMSLQAELDQKNRELELCRENNSNFSAVKSEYLKYGNEYLSEEERTYVSRKIILDKAEQYLLAEGVVMKLRISENTLITTIYRTSMKNASEIIALMLGDTDGIIEYAAATSADNEMLLTDGEGNKIRIPTVGMKVIFAEQGDEEND